MQSRSAIRTEVIDGQLLYFPDEAQWNDILRSGVFEGAEVRPLLMEWASQSRARIKAFPELQLAFGRIEQDNGRKYIFPYVLLRKGQTVQRVYLEVLTCGKCGWEGLTANPHVIDNFIGLTDKAIEGEVRRRSFEKFSRMNCPNCKNQLPRYAIWVEPIRQPGT